MTRPTTRPRTVAPLRREVLVPAGPELAFEVFVDRIRAWWPLGEFSVHGAGASVAFVGSGVGARIVESMAGEADSVWGTVTLWEPGRAVGFTWHPGRGPDSASSVRVDFEPAGEGTLVRLAHTGWEVFGEQAAAARAEYDHGWPVVLHGYAGQVAQVAHEAGR